MIHSRGQIKSGHLSELDAGGKRSSSAGSGYWTLELAAVDDAVLVLATRGGSTIPFCQHAPRKKQQKYRYFVSV